MVTNRIQRAVWFNQDDLQLAHERRLCISETARELFHAFVSGSDNEDATLEKVLDDIKKLREEKMACVTRLNIKEALLSELQKKQKERMQKERKEQEERYKNKYNCCICGKPSKDSVHQVIKFGEFSGRLLCGNVNWGCASKRGDLLGWVVK